MKIEPIFAWYDLWIGAYWDRQKRVLYVLPIPMIGVKISFNVRNMDSSASRTEKDQAIEYLENWASAWGEEAYRPEKLRLREYYKGRMNECERLAGVLRELLDEETIE